MKSAVTLNDKEPQVVTPFVGVWIEIRKQVQVSINNSVTPFVGVWIEITKYMYSVTNRTSHSLRGSVD